jgi:transcriptional regulator with XRE-family HTH domain
MYDLTAFRERVQALYRLASPYEGRRPTQQDLAEAAGLNRSELNRRLRGASNARLTRRDVHAIVKTLAEWGAISAQVEARELLALVDCPDFSAAAWQAPPLDELAPAPAAPATDTQTSNLKPAPPAYQLCWPPAAVA